MITLPDALATAALKVMRSTLKTNEMFFGLTTAEGTPEDVGVIELRKNVSQLAQLVEGQEPVAHVDKTLLEHDWECIKTNPVGGTYKCRVCTKTFIEIIDDGIITPTHGCCMPFKPRPVTTVKNYLSGDAA